MFKCWGRRQSYRGAWDLRGIALLDRLAFHYIIYIIEIRFVVIIL